MIIFGRALQIRAICPDCDEPMGIHKSMGPYSSLGDYIETSDFACVVCDNDGCLSRGYMTTIEKKTGMVVFTEARYKPPQKGEDIDTWTRLWPKFQDKDGKEY